MDVITIPVQDVFMLLAFLLAILGIMEVDE